MAILFLSKASSADEDDHEDFTNTLDASDSEFYPSSETLPESGDTGLESRVEGRLAQRLKRRKNRYRPSRPFHSDFSNDLKYNDKSYYDRDGPAATGYDTMSSSYQAPTSTGYKAPSASYESPSYTAPTYSNSEPTYTAPTYSETGGSETFNDFLNALAAFLPIGLFLAAIPPNLIVINSARKKRSEEEEDLGINSVQQHTHYPFMQKIGVIGYNGLKTVGCQQRFVCEMATFGESEEANSVQKAMLWMARLTPDFVADYAHATQVFKAVRSHECQQFSCPAF